MSACHPRSDCEVVVHMYKEVGEEGEENEPCKPQKSPRKEPY